MASESFGHFLNWLSMARVHQWTKNLLILVPLITAFAFDNSDSLIQAGLAFFSFSLLASATYIGNDLKDVESDRSHPRKRNRAIASGAVRVNTAIAVAVALILLSALVAWRLSLGFQLMLVGYLALTVTYSLVLKEYFLLDVILLALLYTWRILAGSLAIGVETSTWLLAFSTFFFFGLALVKRCAELRVIEARGTESLSGRDYRATDHIVLQSIGVSACLAAVIVFCLFINTPETQQLYRTPEALWLVAVALLYWSSRLWVKTARGEMHDDPVVYALRDRGSRIVLGGAAAVVVLSHYVGLPTQ